MPSARRAPQIAGDGYRAAENGRTRIGIGGMSGGAALRPGATPYLIVAIVWALGHAGLVAIGTTPILEGRIPDTDGYMWLARVEQLWRSGAWFDDVMPRANAPFGDALNWTRPLDVAISALALPLAPFMAWREALFVAGAIVSPLCHLACVLLLAWASRPLIEPASRPLVAFVLIASMGLFAYSIVGRPDHHPLVAIALALLVGGALRLPLGQGVRFFAPAAALGLWLTTEFLMPLGLVAAAGAATWALSPAALPAAIQARAWRATTLLTALALVIERGPAKALARAPDKISLDQLAIVAAAALLWTLLAALEPRLRGVPARVAAGLALALALGIVLPVLLPGIERGPDGAIDPAVMAEFLATTTEMRSILGWDVDSLVEQLRLNALCVVGAAAAAIWWLRARATPQAAGWATIAFLGIGYALATSLHVRFAMFGMIGPAIALAELLRRLRARLTGGLGAVVLRAAAIALVIGGPLSLGIVIADRAGGGTVERALARLEAACDLGAAVPVLTRPDGLGDRPRIIVAHLNLGSELIWRTPHGVLGTPFHRNREGILDGAAFFDARDDATARAIAARRGAELVLFCPLLDHRGVEGSLGQRLAAGAPPAWLVRIPLERTQLALYRIVPG